MSWSKIASEALIGDDDEIANEAPVDTAREKRNRWLKLLATGAGVAGLGMAGYAAYKNWPAIAHKVNNLFGVQDQGWIERHTNNKANAIDAGAATGALTGEASLGLRRMPWNKKPAAGLISLKNTSSAGGDSDLAKSVQGLEADARNGGAKGFTLADTIGKAQLPTGFDSPLVQALNYGRPGKPVMSLAGGPPTSPISDSIKGLGARLSPRLLGPVTRGIGSATAPVEKAVRQGAGYFQSQQQLKQLASKLDTVGAHAAGGMSPRATAINDAVKTQFGQIDSATLGQRLRSMNSLKATTRGVGHRIIGNGLVGAGAGYLGEQLGL